MIFPEESRQVWQLETKLEQGAHDSGMLVVLRKTWELGSHMHSVLLMEKVVETH